MPPLRPAAVLAALVLGPSPLFAQGVAARAAAPLAAVSPQPVLHVPATQVAREVATRAFPAAGAAITHGLRWLLAHQEQDGRWDADEFGARDGAPPGDDAGGGTYDVALTGLASWALAREGAPAAGDPRHAALLRGARWLAAQQGDHGLLGGAATHDYVYGHAIGTLGLAAAAAATADPAAREAAQQALGYLDRHRNPFAVWRYQPRDNDNDSSVTTWATLACLAGHELGLAVDARSFQLVRAWFDQVTDHEGRAGYTRRGEPSSRLVGDHATRFPPRLGEAMTAAALLCRGALGETAASSPMFAKGAALLRQQPPAWQGDGRIDLCYWFFAAEALRRGVDAAERAAWHGPLVDALVKGQRGDGRAAGSWDPIDVWGGSGGRVYATALAVLTLQAVYADEPPAQAR